MGLISRVSSRTYREEPKLLLQTMRCKVTACLLAAVASSTVIELDRPSQYDLENLQAQWPDLERVWTEFKELYEKAYDSMTDEKHRMKIWVDNLIHINKHNLLYKEGKKSYKVEMNQYADMTSEEFLGVRNGYKHILKKERG